MVKEHLACFPLTSAQGLLVVVLESSRTTKCLNNNDEKQTINKTVY
jgi:hypothetical protein